MDRVIRIVLLRHGEAERHAERDELRRLTPRGRDEVRAVAIRMRELGIQPTAVYSSLYLRARETAEIIAGVLATGDVTAIGGITPEDDPRRALAKIDPVVSAGGLPVLVTHMPFIGALAGLLVDGSVHGGAGFVTAAGVLLDGEVFAPGHMQVVHSLQP